MKPAIVFLCALLLWPQTASAITSHRAYYKLKLASVKQESEILDAQGLMTLEMEDVCDGWTLEQTSMTRVQYKTRPTETLNANYAAWESKSGDQLKFFSNRVYNNLFKEGVQGQARFPNAQSGTIQFNQPETVTVSVQQGTLTPVFHIQKLLMAAQQGEKMFSKHVFDGSFYGKPVNINAFIGKSQASCKTLASVGETHKAWPINLAVFSGEGHSSVPNFEINQIMNDQGIMCSYKVDFGEYALEGTLEKVEFLKPACGVGS